MSFFSIMMNYNCKKSDDARDAGLSTPDDVSRVNNILYGTDKRWQILDVYRPKTYEDKLPVIVNVHGGGWVYGTKETYQFYCMSLAQKGFAVVNYNYRLAPKFKYPHAVNDTNSVFEWIMKNSSEYDFDLDNIFAVGDSAGGQLLGQYAAIVTNSEYAGKFEFSVPADLKLRAIALNCGVFNCEKTPKENRALGDYLPKNRFNELTKEITFAHFITPDYPSTFVMTSNEDFLREEPAFLCPILEKNNIEYVSKKYGDDDHHLLHVFHCNIKSDQANECNDDECNFFKKHLN